MRKISFSEATLEAMREEMRHDETVFVMGEDIARQGGIFGQFKGLPQEFGLERVRDTPISETAIVGAGLGSALNGCRPVIDMHFADFLGVAMDEVFNQIAKVRYMFGGQTDVPLVLRAPDGIIRSAAAQHSQSVEAWFLHVPGLKIVIPSNPADAKGLLKSAIRSNDPVLYFEHKALFSMSGEVPEEEYFTPIGKARIARKGKDVTIISYSFMMTKVLAAAEELAAQGIDAEVIDLRTVFPYDRETIAASVAKTHRLLVVHESPKVGGVGAELVSYVCEHHLDELDAPPARLGLKHVPIPFSPPLEQFVAPQKEDVLKAALKLVRG
ncbi:alpha-ketoacid dehydrogenase subunit beta [uncultured Anaeromusa sp.]|uniref:alpha-ketoacid dehydrogenase subunit beta n=1 Tax=uncultured Anaeromusa sp. TaxID=673273 RepID=UPI0029C61427|nr:alpha-ketoacid dehydrogenase subunit beta [uncultured Anaeromusa sp.]